MERHTLTREGSTFGEITVVLEPEIRWSERHRVTWRKFVARLQWAIHGWLQREEYRRSGTELEVIKTKRSSEIARRLQISEGRQHVITSLRANRSLDTTLKFVAEQAKDLLGAKDIVVYYPVDLDEPEIGTANSDLPAWASSLSLRFGSWMHWCHRLQKPSRRVSRS